MDENEEKPNKKSTHHVGLGEKSIQIFSLTLLVVLMVYDKAMQRIVPPLPEYWYIGLFFVGILGTQATEIATKLLDKKDK